MHHFFVENNHNVGIFYYKIAIGVMLSSLKLTSSTALGKQQQKKLTLILSYLIDNPEAAEFLYPVQWQQLGLNDYPLVIKNPMHLLKVQDRLRGRQYRYVEEVLDHIQLVWDNCKEYNQGGPFYALGEKMERSFKKMIKNYLPSIQIIIPSKNPQPVLQNQQSSTSKSKAPQPRFGSIQDPVSGEEPEEIPQSEKNRFNQRLRQISQQQLAQIVAILQESSPQAFKQLEGNRCQIIIDNIDAATFKKINEKIDDFLEGEKISTKKAKS